MFIHLGGEKIIRDSELIAIFDAAIESSSKYSKYFIEQAAKDLRIEKISDEEPKSIVVTADKVYYSPISAATLKKRAMHPLVI